MKSCIRIALILCFMLTACQTRSMAASYSASPFVAAEKADTTDFTSAQATGVGNPFVLSVNSSSPASGTYAGILILPTSGRSAFQNISFTLQGSDALRVSVRYKRDGKGALNFSSLPVNFNSNGKMTSKSNLRRVDLSSRAFRIPAGSTIDRIVITPDTGYGANKFLVSDLRINGAAPARNLTAGTKFFPVTNGIGTDAPLADTAGFIATNSSSVLIRNDVGAAGSSQLFFLQNYGPNTITLVDHLHKSTGIPVTLVPGTTNIYYFTLNYGQTAEYSGYSAATPFQCSIYVPLSTSVNACNVTASDTVYCNSSTGVTLVEPNIYAQSSDTIDISEVSGVNAQWQVELPCGWVTGAYLNASQQYIPVSVVKNNPGAAPYYGDYGNPGVYPFGCTNCASRYNYETYAPGCSTFSYPSNDVGCDNAINYYPNNTASNPTANPPNPAYEVAPPTVTHGLPVDKYAPGKRIFDLSTLVPLPALGYGICQLTRSTQCSGGTIKINLKKYPY